MSRDCPTGQITVICGAMFAGKSEELIRLARRALYAKKVVQVFKPALDDRVLADLVVTHVGATHNATSVLTVNDLDLHINHDAQTICIDEVQFFDEGLVDLVVDLADAGREVICAGLDQDFRRLPFGPMPLLMAVADEVIKLRAICVQCGAPASHSQRHVNGVPVSAADPLVRIGAQETYEARCRRCHEILGQESSRWRQRPWA